ncbi:NAD(P)-binding protein [Sarocladium strictum]
MSSAKHSGGAFTTTRHVTSYEFISPLKLYLTGKNVLLTGATYEDGMPEALIEKLKVAATDSGRQAPSILSFVVDISDSASVQAMHSQLAQHFNRHLDILVNNAAFQEPYKLFLHSDPNDYWRVWEVNMRGLFNTARTFLPMQLAARADGSLCTMINLSSSGGLSPRQENGSYRTSKLAVLRWSETLQLEYGDQGLLAYCVNPGAIKTPMSKALPDSIRDLLPDKPDIAGDTIFWLAANRKEWLAGRYVSCPWDMEELLAKKDEIVEKDLLKMRMDVGQN